MIDEELSAKQIAHRLKVTEKCITKQVKRFYDKIGVQGRMGMVKKVYAERDRFRAEKGP
jgi:DNA-binding NarL/FixJ family response regulator